MPSVFLNRSPPYSLEMESHTAPDFTVLAKWLAGELQLAACLPLPTLQLQVRPLYLALFCFIFLYCGTEDSNSDPHAQMVSPLPTEPTPPSP